MTKLTYTIIIIGLLAASGCASRIKSESMLLQYINICLESNRNLIKESIENWGRGFKNGEERGRRLCEEIK